MDFISQTKVILFHKNSITKQKRPSKAGHKGDTKAAIKAMQDEIEHLRQQLSLAVVAMGRGYTRSWVPAETDLVNEALPARQSKQQD